MSLQWYLDASRNLGLVSLARYKARGLLADRKLTSKYLNSPVSYRDGSSDEMVFHQIFIDREYAVIDDLEAPDFIIDAGANVGYSAAYFLSRYPHARLVAVEPDADNAAMVRKNLAPYGQRCTVIEAALWFERTHLNFKEESTGEGKEWSRRVEAGDAGDDGLIPTVTIPDIMRDAGVSRISLLKMDIEGAEEQVFARNNEWLALVDNFVAEVHGPDCAAALEKAIAGMNFKISYSGELTVGRRPRT